MSCFSKNLHYVHRYLLFTLDTWIWFSTVLFCFAFKFFTFNSNCVLLFLLVKLVKESWSLHCFLKYKENCLYIKGIIYLAIKLSFGIIDICVIMPGVSATGLSNCDTFSAGSLQFYYWRSQISCIILWII